jgi:hypothetical protein
MQTNGNDCDSEVKPDSEVRLKKRRILLIIYFGCVAREEWINAWISPVCLERRIILDRAKTR